MSIGTTRYSGLLKRKTNFNSRGKIVKELSVYTVIPPIQWDATDCNGAPVANGMYFYTLSTDRGVVKGTFLLVKWYEIACNFGVTP